MESTEIFNLIKTKFPQVNQEPFADTISAPKDILLNLVDYLRQGGLAFDNLHCVTAVDRKEKIELVYIFYSLSKRHRLILKVFLAPDNLEVESLTKFYKSADWLEREVFDMFGVKFLNHPDLRRILNPSDWQGYPLRKDFTHPNLIKKP